jgi:uncharacterized membrane-anchored protein YhcB (DUF1043 family)
MSLDLDIGTIWDNVNANIPWIMAVMAIPAGIAIGIKVVTFVADAIQKAF